MRAAKRQWGVSRGPAVNFVLVMCMAAAALV